MSRHGRLHKQPTHCPVEAELYAMVEATTRAKGHVSLAKELGFSNLDNAICLGADSTAAKQFVSRQGLGRMRHLHSETCGYSVRSLKAMSRCSR